MRSHVIPGLLAAIFIAGAAVAQSLVPSHGPPAAARSILAAEKVFAAKAGDMGLTWGRWTYTPREAGAKLSTGRYVTVWRKNAKGAWKAIIDMGNPDPS